MKNILIDTVGFCGTHTLSNSLKGIGDIEVVHGTQNLDTEEHIGKNNLTPYIFMEKMHKKSEKLKKNIIAIHCNFDIKEALNACSKFEVDYICLVRNLHNQIMSCYSWAYLKLINGNDTILNEALNVFKANELLPTIKVELSLPNIVYMWACYHVMCFNLNALNLECKILKMEELFTSQELFKETFGIKEFNLNNLDSSKKNNISHKENLRKYRFKEPKSEKIYNSIYISGPGYSISLPELNEKLGY